MKHSAVLKQYTAKFLVLTCLVSPLLSQSQTAEDPAQNIPATPDMSQDQIRDLIREAAEKDMQNDKKQRDYTYIQREEEHKLDGNDQVKSSESKTYEIMVLYEEPVRKLIARDDKPLSENDTRKEDEKVQKIIEKRKNESDNDRQKRLEKQNKEQEDGRQFVKEIADAYNFPLRRRREPGGAQSHCDRRRSSARLRAAHKRCKVSTQVSFSRLAG